MSKRFDFGAPIIMFELAAIAGAAFGGAIIDNALLAHANYSHCGVHKSKLLMY